MYMHIYIHTHTYIYTYMHIYKYICSYIHVHILLRAPLEADCRSHEFPRVPKRKKTTFTAHNNCPKVDFQQDK